MTEPGLAALLETAGLKRGVRALRLGRASGNVQKQLEPLLASYAAPVTTIEDDPFNVPLPGPNGLCVVTLPLARMPDVFEELIYDQLLPAVEPGGVVLVQFCRDVSDAALDALKVSHPQTRAGLQEFARAQFGGAVLSDPAPLVGRFADDTAYEFFGWASRSRRPAAEEPLVWLVLRRRSTTGAAHAFERSDRPDRYPLRDVRGLIAELKEADISLVPVDTFAARIESGAAQPSFGLLKLDLHRQIRRPLEVARMLSHEGVRALFLMMPRHPFNETFFDAPQTWDILRAVADGGHEIGLHLDVFHLIGAFGDLYKGIEAAVGDFGKRGFTVRAATLHGDTRKHVVERGMVREDFFEEDAAMSRWDGRPPVGEENLADHVRRYSYRALTEKFGIAYLAEERFRKDGRRIREAPLTYVTDNNRSLQVRNIPAGEGATSLTAPQPFRIDAAFARTVAQTLRAHPFLALFHPQWLW